MTTPEPLIIAGRNLARLRHRAGLTQAELSASAGIAKTYVGQIERAQKSASLDVLGRLAAALGVEPADLLRPLSLSQEPPRGVHLGRRRGPPR